MSNSIFKKGWCFSIVILLIVISTSSATVSAIDKDFSLKSINNPGDNILGNVTVIWDKALSRPKVIFEYEWEKIFEFPEDSNGKVTLNFTINIKHKLDHQFILPFRLTHVEVTIYDPSSVIFYRPWFSYGWYLTYKFDGTHEQIYIDQSNPNKPGWQKDIYTNGKDYNCTVLLLVSGYPFGLLIKTSTVAFPITIRPIVEK